MPAGPTPASKSSGLLSLSNCDLSSADKAQACNQGSQPTSSDSSSQKEPESSIKKLSSSSNNQYHVHQSRFAVHSLQPPSASSSRHGSSRFLAAAPSPEVALSRRSAHRSGSGTHQRRTLRNINAIKFLRSIKVDGEPHVFTEAEEHQTSACLAPSAVPSGQSVEIENLNVGGHGQVQLEALQRAISSGGTSQDGSSPINVPSLVIDLELEGEKNGAIPMQILASDTETFGRKSSTRSGNASPIDGGAVSPIDVSPKFESVFSPSTPSNLSLQTSTVKQLKRERESDEQSAISMNKSGRDVSPTPRSPRHNSGSFSQSSHQTTIQHQVGYQGNSSNGNSHHRSPPLGGGNSSHREVVRVTEQVRYSKSGRDEDLRAEAADKDISSKSFRLRHASQRDHTNATGAGLGGIEDFGHSISSIASNTRSNSTSNGEVSFSNILVVTANAFCRSFVESQSGSNSNNSVHSSSKHHRQAGDVEILMYEYDPETLDSPTFLQSVNRSPVVMPSYNVTVLGYYDPGSAKKLLNDQFRERFPGVQLTFTKMRSLKREMKKIGLKCTLDLWCIAQSYVFFEKLILKKYIKKPNRKMCAGSCLLLAAKLNDIRKSKIPSLIQEIENTFRIDREDLFTCEFNVFLALDFSLMIPDCEVIPHLMRLIEQHHQSTGASLVFGSSNAVSATSALHYTGSLSSLALLQQHMQQHAYFRMPHVCAPTSTSSALQTSSGNGSSGVAIASSP